MNTINNPMEINQQTTSNTAPFADMASYAEQFENLRNNIDKTHAETLVDMLLQAEKEAEEASCNIDKQTTTKSLPVVAQEYLLALQNAPATGGKFSFYDLAGEIRRQELLHENTVGEIRYILKGVARGLYTEDDSDLLQPVIWALTYAVLGQEAAARLQASNSPVQPNCASLRKPRKTTKANGGK
jgi:hypothetical protein